MIKIIQVGLGPIAQKITQYLRERPALKLVGAVDTDPKLIGIDVGELVGIGSCGVLISGDLSEVLKESRAEVAIVTTGSTVEKSFETMKTILLAGVNVVTSCEELAFALPDKNDFVRQLDSIAQAHGVTLLSTGVNPGFLMDYLPVVVSGVHQRVDSVLVERIQDASTRREPFKKKIGFGASDDEFARRVKDKTLRHVGLRESLEFVLHYLGLKVVNMEETIGPVKSGNKITGVIQTAVATNWDGKEIGRLVFKASVGEKDPKDRIVIKGEPDTEVIIPGAVHGDIATCAILLNAIPSVLQAQPGYRTMAEIYPPHWRL